MKKTLLALSRAEGESFVLLAPCPGYLRIEVRPGSVQRSGDIVGELEVLGVRYRLEVPKAVDGVVRISARSAERIAVGYGTEMLRLEPGAPGVSEREEGAALRQASGEAALVFRSPIGGRFYERPSPSAEAFVRAGDLLTQGHTVALVEVMKTFHRVTYGGDELPERARVKRLSVRDGDDVQAGDVLLELESI